MMAATMVSGPIIVPLRWLGRGADIRVHITPDQQVLVYGFDVFRTLGLYTDTIAQHHAYPLAAATLLPAGVLFRDDVVDESRSATPLYPLHRIAQICHHSPAAPTLVDELLDWLGEQVADLLHPPAPAQAVHPEPGLRELAAGGTYSIRRSAKILSRDPALTYGQQSLFDAMAALGWTTRELGIWVPHEDPLRDGFLVRHQVKLGYERRGERVLYPQIRVTIEGLHELHRRLGGVAKLTVEEPPALTLLDGIA